MERIDRLTCAPHGPRLVSAAVEHEIDRFGDRQRPAASAAGCLLVGKAHECPKGVVGALGDLGVVWGAPDAAPDSLPSLREHSSTGAHASEPVSPPGLGEDRPALPRKNGGRIAGSGSDGREESGWKLGDCLPVGQEGGKVREPDAVRGVPGETSRDDLWDSQHGTSDADVPRQMLPNPALAPPAPALALHPRHEVPDRQSKDRHSDKASKRRGQVSPSRPRGRRMVGEWRHNGGIVGTHLIKVFP